MAHLIYGVSKNALFIINYKLFISLMFPDLVPIGLATIMLGTIHETDGVQEHQFWLRNDGAEAVVLQQGYASCHCTTIDFEQGATVAPGDSTCVTLRFNPQGKGGEFYESGTVKYRPTPAPSLTDPPPCPSLGGRGEVTTSSEESSDTVVSTPLPLREGQGGGSFTVAFEGTCITSEETLLKQYPIQLNEHLSLTRDRFDLGIMPHGSQRTLYVSLLHWDEDRRSETFPIVFTADRETAQKGGAVSHIPITLATTDGGAPFTFTITLDVIVK